MTGPGMKQKIGTGALAENAMQQTTQDTGFAHARPFEHAPVWLNQAVGVDSGADIRT